MKSKIYLLLLLMACSVNAQETSVLESHADEWAMKSYMQSKALSAYLTCFRQTTDKGEQSRLIQKAATLLINRSSLMSKDVYVVDSLIKEARPAWGKDIKTFLPLLEQRIIKAPYSAEKYQAEFILYEEAIALRNENHITSGVDYEELLRWYVGKLIYKKDISKEEKLKAYSHLWDVYRANSPDIDSLDIKLLDNYALQCSLCRQPQISIMLHELKKEYILRTSGKESEAYLDVIQTLYLDYSSSYSASHLNANFEMTAEKQKELDYRVEWYQLKDATGAEISSTDVKSLVYTLAAYNKDTVTARQIASEYMAGVQNTHNKESAEFCQALSVVIGTYQDTDKDVIPLLEELLSLQERAFGKNDDNYKATEAKLSYALSRNHQMQKAIDMQKSTSKAEDIISLLTLSTQQMQYGLYREAIETYEKMLEYCAAHPQEKGLYMISAILGPINCFNKLKDTDGLLAFSRKWSNDCRFTLEEQTFVFKNALSTASQPANVNENVLSLVDTFMLSHPDLMNSPIVQAEVLEQKATAYFGLLQFEKAETIIRSILTSLYKAKADQITSLKYEQYLEICKLAQERWDDAIVQNQQVLSHISQIPNYTKCYEYRALCCRAAIYQDRKNNFDEVLRLCSIIDDFDINTAASLDSNSAFSFSTFSVLSSMLDASVVEKCRFRAFYKKDMKSNAAEWLKNTTDEKIHLLQFTLSQLDNSMLQSSFTWTQEYNDILMNIALLNGSDDLYKAGYDYTLLYKEAFLTTENLMRNQLLNSENDVIKNKFAELQKLRTSIQQYEAANLPTQELEQRRVQLERQLVEDSKMYGDFTQSLHSTWDTVCKYLAPTDMAIEFVSYQSFDDEKKHIAALLVRPQWKTPKLLHLFSEEQIPEDIYNDAIFSKICWGPILNYAQGVKNIYFSPSGALYNINIESLIHPDGSDYLSEKYHLYRISSTREICRLKNLKKVTSAVIYGGIDYGGTTTLSNMNNSERHSEIRALIEDIEYLPGSMREATDINTILQAKPSLTKTQLYTGTAGTENSFKNISGQDVHIVHISTHGFYNNSQVDSHDKTSTLYILNQDTEDRSLTRSGLLMAGAENALYGDEIRRDNEDGILTALEISTLDLRNVDMAVLSACQTAQGDVKSDGVFGLQRGFKKAGANSILMSLWKVDDEATCQLMTEFYRNWIEKGKTKHEAFELAKRTVRARTDKGWDNPKYWAAFILLDGIEN